MKITALIFIFAVLTGCATTGPVSGNYLDTLKDTGSLGENEGVLLMSAGRERNPCDECNANFLGILPFVSYSIFLEQEDAEPQELAFIPAEGGAWNQIGEGHYGFIHMRELPEGNYLMIGIHSRGHDVIIPGGSYFVTFSDGKKETVIAYRFSIQKGKVNYLGEFLTTNGTLENSSINQSRHLNRDLEYAVSKYPELANFEVVEIEPQNP